MLHARRFACGFVAVAHVVVAAAIVLVWRLGPVMATLDDAGNHGVHQGDLLALPLVAMGVAWLTRAAQLQPVAARGE